MVPLGTFGAILSEWLLLSSLAAGYRNNSSGGINNVGSNGNYWLASSNSQANAYNLNFNSGTVNPQNNNNRANGFAVRPVLRSQHLISRTNNHKQHGGR